MAGALNGSNAPQRSAGNWTSGEAEVMPARETVAPKLESLAVPRRAAASFPLRPARREQAPARHYPNGDDAEASCRSRLVNR